MTTDLLRALPGIGDLLAGWQLVLSIIGIPVLAALGGRLLGTRRSLGVVLVSGLCGWAAGAALALILARSRYAPITRIIARRGLGRSIGVGENDDEEERRSTGERQHRCERGAPWRTPAGCSSS